MAVERWNSGGYMCVKVVHSFCGVESSFEKIFAKSASVAWVIQAFLNDWYPVKR